MIKGETSNRIAIFGPFDLLRVTSGNAWEKTRWANSEHNLIVSVETDLDFISSSRLWVYNDVRPRSEGESGSLPVVGVQAIVPIPWYNDMLTPSSTLRYSFKDKKSSLFSLFERIAGGRWWSIEGVVVSGDGDDQSKASGEGIMLSVNDISFRDPQM
jgi:hypothetical protein